MSLDLSKTLNLVLNSNTPLFLCSKKSEEYESEETEEEYESEESEEEESEENSNVTQEEECELTKFDINFGNFFYPSYIKQF